MGLNLTSTKPFLRFVSSLKHTGYVAFPDCLRTFGGLGADASASTVHFASPLPVLVAVQPGGGAPTLRLSKLIASANTTMTNTVTVSMTTSCTFMEPSLIPEGVLQLHQQLIRFHVPA